ncbi:MAG: hypothetical protein IJD93_00325 [Ruminococcus sp.]|nr:hypothetical protein [Ruminococcus sp.]
MKRNLWLVCLCLLLAILGTLTGCKGTEGTTPDEAVTTVTDATKTLTSDTQEITTTPETTAEVTESTEKVDNNTPVAKPVDRDETPKYATVNVGGQEHSVKVGDRIVYTCYLKTPKAIENIQASLTYDDSILWFRHTSDSEMFPNLGSVIYNANITGRVLFNASNVAGYNFTDNNTLITLEFDVAKEGYTSIATAIEFMDEKGGNPYIDNFNVIGDVTITETLS